MSELYRRSSNLVCYWRGRHFVIENYATRSRVAATPDTWEILQFFDRWRPAGSLAELFPRSGAAALARALVALLGAGLLERSRAPRDPRLKALDSWSTWSPAASFFHLSTKDAHAPIEPEDSVRALQRQARTNAPPPSIKRYLHARQIALPSPATAGELPRVLMERRTWRQFSRRPVDLDQLATLLGLSFGVQWWLDVHGVGRVALKTSPSGGSRHPIEAYVLALRVRGLRRGLYHYNAAAHRLALLRRGARANEVVKYLNGQWWFGGASAVVLMTAVFGRTQWKYPAPRAYRVVLIDAGHVCQTFCLTATWLGLAPFCTMALADSAIERALDIDGVTESIIYAAGVGARPKDSDWAPWEGRRAYGRRVRNRQL